MRSCRVTTALSNFLLGSSSKGKNAWSEEEDCKLREMVEKYTTTNWTSIAEAFPDRSGKQCRERWHNHLQEGILKGSWSNDEDAIICALQQRLGNQWSKITKYLPGRTDNSVKNRFHALQRSRKRYTDADVPAGFVLPLFVTDASLLVDVETTQSTKLDQQGAQWVHQTGAAYEKEQADADLGIYEEEYEYEEQYTESPYQYQPTHATYSAPVPATTAATAATAMSTGHVVPPPPPPPRHTAPQTPMQQQQQQHQRLGQDGQPLSGAASPLSAAAMSIGDLDEMLDGEEGGDDEAFGFSADCIHVPTFATYEWGSNSFAHNKSNGGCDDGEEEEEEDMDVQEGNQSYCSSFMHKIIAPKPVSSSGFSSMLFCDPSGGGAYTGEAQQAYSLEMAQVDPTTYQQQHYQYQHQQQQYYQQQQQQHQYQGGGFSAFAPSSSFCGNR